MVIFGGATGQIFGDTWVWDGNDWTQKSPANSPPARGATAMAYDAARQQIVLFGGFGNNGSDLADTWIWDGNNWTQKMPANSPDARTDHQMVFDEARQEVVLFGGDLHDIDFSDTWVWNGSTWSQEAPATSPPALRFHAMTYDSVRQQTILFGGYGLNGPSSDTWLWDGINWTKFAGADPSPRYDVGMAFDPVQGQAIIFGGDNGTSIVSETWTFGSALNRRRRSTFPRACSLLSTCRRTPDRKLSSPRREAMCFPRPLRRRLVLGPRPCSIPGPTQAQNPIRSPWTRRTSPSRELLTFNIS